MDTNIVIFLLNGRLSAREEEIVLSGPIGISAIVFWELAKLKQLGRINISIEDGRFKSFLEKCVIWRIDVEIALASTSLDFRSDPADELIAGTSIAKNVPLLTRDSKILASKIVPLAV